MVGTRAGASPGERWSSASRPVGLTPTRICAEILAGLHKPNFTVQMLPTGHGLLVNPTGLDADDQRSPGLAPVLVPTITDWLRAR